MRRRLSNTLSAGLAVRTPGGLLARLGRVLLWLAVGVVLVRGVGSVLAGERPIMSHRIGHAAAATWPDDAARALAVEFATAYLTHAPGDDPAAFARRLAAMASVEVAQQLAPRWDRRAERQAVRSATAARSLRVDNHHALVTVAATVAVGHAVGARWLTVPVARDQHGNLIVYDLPSFASAPGRAQAGPPEGEPLAGPERAPITDVLGRFLRAYLVGDTGALRYLVPAGTRVAAAGGRLDLLSLGSLVDLGHASARDRLVAATVHVRDPRSRVAYWLRYRARLVHRDRWYVAALNAPGNGRER